MRHRARYTLSSIALEVRDRRVLPQTKFGRGWHHATLLDIPGCRAIAIGPFYEYLLAVLAITNAPTRGQMLRFVNNMMVLGGHRSS